MCVFVCAYVSTLIQPPRPFNRCFGIKLKLSSRKEKKSPWKKKVFWRALENGYHVLYMCVCIQSATHTHTHIHMHTLAHSHTQTHTHTHTRTHTQHRHVHTHTHTHTHGHTPRVQQSEGCMYMHTCVLRWLIHIFATLYSNVSSREICEERELFRCHSHNGIAMINRLHKCVRLFCKRGLNK